MDAWDNLKQHLHELVSGLESILDHVKGEGNAVYGDLHSDVENAVEVAQQSGKEISGDVKNAIQEVAQNIQTAVSTISSSTGSAPSGEQQASASNPTGTDTPVSDGNVPPTNTGDNGTGSTTTASGL